jgi:hypothetical protein
VGEPPLVQVWGPRYSAIVVAERDSRPVHTGRLPDEPQARQRAADIADRLESHPRPADATFSSLRRELLGVRTPIGEAWILASDESAFGSADGASSTRLLPSGDAYFLLQGEDRELLVPDAAHRSRLWTSRVWPGAVLLDGEIVGTWRRSEHKMTVPPWRTLRQADREAIEDEAASLPLPRVTRSITVTWESATVGDVTCSEVTQSLSVTC